MCTIACSTDIVPISNYYYYFYIRYCFYVLPHFLGVFLTFEIVLERIDFRQEMVLLSNQSVRAISIPNIVWSHVLSSMNPNTVIPALLFSK